MRVKNKSTGEIRDEDDDYTLKEGEEEVEFCAICLEDDTPENPLVTLHTPEGNARPHKFHVECGKRLPEWDQIPHRLPIKCPECRAPISDGPLIEQLTTQAQAKGEAILLPKIPKVPQVSLTQQLLEACKDGNTERTELLIEQGVDVNSKDNNGKTALINASYGGHTGCIKMLIERDVYLNAKDIFGKTALMYASYKGHVGAIEMLIANGADVNAKSVHDKTALMEAAGSGHVECVAMLLDSGANVNAKDDYGMTALIEASYKGSISCVNKLLESDANINAKTKDGMTARKFAIKYGYNEIANLLKKLGAT